MAKMSIATRVANAVHGTVTLRKYASLEAALKYRAKVQKLMRPQTVTVADEYRGWVSYLCTPVIHITPSDGVFFVNATQDERKIALFIKASGGKPVRPLEYKEGDICSREEFVTNFVGGAWVCVDPTADTYWIEL